jgi:Fe-S cluster biogenesis protein NfuA
VHSKVTRSANGCTLVIVRERAEALIAEYIRPLVEADGGRIDVVEAADKRVVLRFSGLCAGCPGQPFTLSRVIEPLIKRMLGADTVIEARISTLEPQSD